MKKLIVASALILSLFTISYTIASALDSHGVVAMAGCTDDNCNN
jgi:hypothetical protein